MDVWKVHIQGIIATILNEHSASLLDSPATRMSVSSCNCPTILLIKHANTTPFLYEMLI